MVLSSLFQSAHGETEARLGSLWLQLRDSGDEKKEATPLRGSLGETKVLGDRGREDVRKRRPVGRFCAGGKAHSTAEAQRAGMGEEHVTRSSHAARGRELHAGARAPARAQLFTLSICWQNQ